MTILNQQYNYLFLHVPKAAGKSIKSHLLNESYSFARRRELQLGFTLGTLSAYAGSSAILGNLIPPVLGPGVDPRVRDYCKKNSIRTTAHLRAEEMFAILGEEQYRAMFSFAFARNPWDRCLSAYFYFQRKVFHPLHKLAIGHSFEDFLLEQEKDGMPHIAQQVHWMYRNEEEKLVDFIGKVENIESDMAYVCDKINLGGGQFSAQTNVSEARGRDYRPYYTDRAVEIVARSMRSDIELLGYSY
jgi:hypothetical protein